MRRHSFFFSRVFFLLLFRLSVSMWKEPYAYGFLYCSITFFFLFMELSTFLLSIVFGLFLLFLFIVSISLFSRSSALCLPCFRSVCCCSHLGSCLPLHIAPLYHPNQSPPHKNTPLVYKASLKHSQLKVARLNRQHLWNRMRTRISGIV